MAVIAVTVTNAPTAVAGLAAGTTYILQNQGQQSVFVDTAAVAPAGPAAAGVEVPPRRSKGDGFVLHSVEPTATESVYLWTQVGTSRVVLAQAI